MVVLFAAHDGELCGTPSEPYEEIAITTSHCCDKLICGAMAEQSEDRLNMRSNVVNI